MFCRGPQRGARAVGLTPTLPGAKTRIMSDPIRHHYLAIFYLERWAGEGSLLCRFSRPYGDKIVSKRVSPRGTAYEEHLYSMHSASGLPVADMERDFMSRLDSEAAEALAQLEVSLPDSKWDNRLRSAWSRFVWAQSIRTPSEIAQLKSSVKEEWGKALPELQDRYAELRPDNAPEKVDDYYASCDPYIDDRFALSTASRLMDHPGIIETLNNMHWKVIDFAGCGIQLLTSDCPVWMRYATRTRCIYPDADWTHPALCGCARGDDNAAHHGTQPSAAGERIEQDYCDARGRVRLWGR